MKLKTILFFLFLGFQGFSQNQARFHSLCNQACKALEEGMIDHAYILLTEAFSEKIPARAADYLNLAKCYSQQNEADSTEKYIYLAHERNRRIGKTIRIHNLWFEPVLGQEKWNKIVELTKSQTQTELPAEIDTVCEQFSILYSRYRAIELKYESINEFFHRDSILSDNYWKDIHLLTDSIAPFLDSILTNTPSEILIHPACEGGFSMLVSRIKNEYFEERRTFFEGLMAKGFCTPNLLVDIYFREYFADKPTELSQFKHSEYNPVLFEFYNKYGVVFDNKMHNFRILNNWKYDE